MTEAASQRETANYQIFRECVSGSIIGRSPAEKKKPRKRVSRKVAVPKDGGGLGVSDVNDPEELAEFIDYIAAEAFYSLPEEVQTIAYSAAQNDEVLANKYADPIPASTLEGLVSAIPVSVLDSLETYGLLPLGTSDLSSFVNPVLRDYIAGATAAPPTWLSTKTSYCEICERDWIPLTYHHLIPRGVHAKVLKRGWHEEWRLNSVAWLCRACHSFVHRMASNEELAREWYTVERILERDDAQDWKKWVGKVRWKAR